MSLETADCANLGHQDYSILGGEREDDNKRLCAQEDYEVMAYVL